jgi:hypothetical protein
MGIPCLVLKESHIAIHVENGVDGYIATDEQEYLEILQCLAQNIHTWKSLSESTYYNIRETYQLKKITDLTMQFYRNVYSSSPRNTSKVLLPMTTLSRVLSGMGPWAKFIASNPEQLSDLEIEYALHCEGGVIHYANMLGMDYDLKALIDSLFTVLENRRKREPNQSQ